MSTSLLYHAYGLRGYRYVRTTYEKGAVIFGIVKDSHELRCAACGSREVIRRGKLIPSRLFRSLPIGGKAVWISLAVQRVGCLVCGVVRQASLGFALPRRTYTKAFERYALELSRCMTIQDVARHLGVGWDIIKDIQKRYLTRRFSKPKLKKLKRIAIDEISIGKGHQYVTVVLDLKTGAVVFVGEGKGAEALDPFWKKLKSARAHIEAVAMDMSPAYIRAATENLKEATIVFDHFHVIKLFNDKMSEFRRKLYSEATTALGKRVLKGTRWLLLKNPENLDENRDEHQRLQDALHLNQPLATAYYMKEDLRQLWSLKDKSSAAAFLDDWILRGLSESLKG